MSNLKNLGDPTEFWEYFEKIIKIPRCSRQEEKIRDFVREEAQKLGFPNRIDNVGNLAIRVPSISDLKSRCVLQCHLDMVCEKNEDTLHDFLKDPLKLRVIEINNEKWLTAEGTTLGADNGTGICYILTLMKKIHNKELQFKSLGFDFLFTIREEYDMGGAKNIEKNLVDGDFLINLDSGGENDITIGCVGGISIKAKIYKESINRDQIKENLIPIKFHCTGLKGGHSGEDCNKGRGNAIKILIQILWKLNKIYSFYLNSINGGGAANAIPREAKAIIFVKNEDFSAIKASSQEFFIEIKKQFEGVEIDMNLSIKNAEDLDEYEILTPTFQDKLFDVLYLIPSQVISMHPKIENLPFSSTNLGVLKRKIDYIKIRMLHRSFSSYYNEETCEKVFELLKMSGLKTERIIRSSYPPWTPNFNYKLLNITKTAYKDTFNKEPNIRAIHGGLEATILINKIPGIEAIAIGPTAKGLHSPDESLHIKSVERIWTFLINLLKKLD